jgi:aspartate kinase
MKVFKFGGASVKNAQNIDHVAHIIKEHLVSEPIIVVVSAIDKTTNEIEKTISLTIEDKPESIASWDTIIEKHFTILSELGFDVSHEIFQKLSNLRNEIVEFIEKNESTNFNFIYDQLVSKGEWLSSMILNAYLQKMDLNSQWIDAKSFIKTDNNYTDANILWDETKAKVQQFLSSHDQKVYVTQGFIGASPENFYTTLGREGSDYSAAIIAYCIDSKELTIWKDVDGVYTGDPKKLLSATKIERLSYQEAIEMTYYGAQVIHPKTIKPIQNNHGQLVVRSFINKDVAGTLIGHFPDEIYQPVIVMKDRQVIYHFMVKDFSFLNESNLGKIITVFAKHSLRLNYMQNTAIEFIVATDEKLGKNEAILKELNSYFDITVQKDFQLLTIRHYNQFLIEELTKEKSIYLSQRTPDTVQFLWK